MANIGDIKRLQTQDFPKDQQDLVSKLAYAINPFMENVVGAFSNAIDFTNLNQQIASFSITVDSTGKPIASTSIKYTLKTSLQGCVVISAMNSTDSTPLTSAPFISYSVSSNQVGISSITGLVANKKYNITAILIG